MQKGIYNYCEVWEWKNFNVGTQDGLKTWDCVNWDKVIPCSSSCTPWTDNYDPYYLCADDNDDSIYVNLNHSFSWTNTSPWLTVTRSWAWWVKDMWYVHYDAAENPSSSPRTYTVKFETDDPNYCSNWSLTLVQCWKGKKCSTSRWNWTCTDE